MTILWLHLKNSSIRFMIPVLIALDVAIILLRDRYWIGVWPDTGAVAQLPAYLLAPLIAGAAAWAATAPVRAGMTEQTQVARRRSAVVEAYRLAATCMLLLTPYLVGQLCGVVLTAPTRAPGLAIWFGYFLVGMFVILLGVAVGWVTGIIFRSTLAPVAALVSCVLLLAAIGRWSDAIVVSGSVETRINLGGMVMRLVLVSVLLVMMLWLPVAGRPGKGAVIGTAAFSAALLGVMVGGNVLTKRQSAGLDASCTEGAITLCVWPEHQKYIPELKRINERVSALPSALARPQQINESGIGNGSVPSFIIAEGSTWSSAGDIATAILAKTFRYESDACRWNTQSAVDAGRGDALQAWLETRLAGGGNPDYQTNAPEEMQQAWATGRARAIEYTTSEQFEWAVEEVGDLYRRYCDGD